jgi:2-methylisocitrate lyase-like PEP mutase family enzyme
MTAGSPGRRLRELIAAPGCLVLPGAADALTARLVERAGFEAVYVTGAGIANVVLGRPDVGLTTLSEIVAQVEHIADVVDVPLLVDMDTGFGNAINARRAVRDLERAGAAGIQVEDQTFPKRCGHFSGKEVVSLAEMRLKIQAVADARRDPSTVIVARTDALALDGVDAAVERGQAFVEAGADVVFIEAPRTREELASLPARVPAPLLANMVEGGKTPLCSAAELGAMGYAAVLFANTAMRVAAQAAGDALIELRRTGDAAPLMDRMLSWQDRQALVGLPEIEALERRYAESDR